ncbi:MAG: DNA polymerase III subunit beta [Desulfobacteraceae bacterium]
MNFSCDRKNISEVLSKIQGITGKKTTLAITSDVLLKVQGSSLYVTANDLETVFMGEYEVTAESEGIISINSQKLFEITREYPDPQIPVNEIEDRWVEIGKNNILYHLFTSDYEKFPKTPIIEDVSFIEVKSQVFKKMVAAASVIGFKSEEKRIYVMGALFEKIDEGKGEKVRMVSTDSRRLNSFETEFEGDFASLENNVLIPKKGISEINKFIDNKDSVKIGIKDNHFIVKKEKETLMIKLLEGEFPQYERILNTESSNSFEIDKNQLLMIMKRMSILSSDDYKTVLFDLRNDKLIFTITNPEIGESKEEIPVNYSGDEFESAFNPKYFIDALNLIDDETVVLYVKDSKSPCIIKGIDNDCFVCAIMAIFI